MSFKTIGRNAILKDEHEPRLRRIKLIGRETAEMAPIWAVKQVSLYPTALPIGNASNPDVLIQRAELKLKENSRWSQRRVYSGSS